MDDSNSHILKYTEKEKVNYMTFQMRIDEERDEAREKVVPKAKVASYALYRFLLKSGKTETRHTQNFLRFLFIIGVQECTCFLPR